jgi:hypothetical protein
MRKEAVGESKGRNVGPWVVRHSSHFTCTYSIGAITIRLASVLEKAVVGDHGGRNKEEEVKA